MNLKDYVQDYFKQENLVDKKDNPIAKCPDIIKEIKALNNADYVNLVPYHYDFNASTRQRYPYPYPLINCDDNCKKRINYKASVANREIPYVKKNEDVTEESIISTNKTYTLLYLWFIIMIIVIYVLIIAFVSENSYHPLMNIIIFIFLVYMSYYLYNNLSL